MIAFSNPKAFELAPTTEQLQVGGGYTVLKKNYLN